MIKLMLTVTITRNLRTINYKMRDRTIDIISLIVIFGIAVNTSNLSSKETF